ncbi:MAG: 16S rRNA (uracil(1498)-N(3))-methyltransferase [Bacteroidetes bacterium]|nr:16S rRNA (uracil(1498)-N(3))-methyltransferase [Bacteroidota bacterium]MBS1540907.1 16S rRNA (uracil(1498)-N(3))-methyltransferase [Bacteroidota bacterium]
MNLFYQPEICHGVHHLSEEETRHAKVLRLKRGDAIDLTDGLGFFYTATITKVDKQCEFEITKKKAASQKKFSIHIAIAPTKNADRMEWFVEKATEIGINKISFVLCQKSERKTINIDRIEKIAVSAMKQSHQAWLPKISGIKKFSEIICESADQKFIAFVEPQNPLHLKQLTEPNKNYMVLIGPEGDFSDEELKMAQSRGFQKVSLGENRLRTETAGLMVCSILNFIQ